MRQRLPDDRAWLITSPGPRPGTSAAVTFSAYGRLCERAQGDGSLGLAQHADWLGGPGERTPCAYDGQLRADTRPTGLTRWGICLVGAIPHAEVRRQRQAHALLGWLLELAVDQGLPPIPWTIHAGEPGPGLTGHGQADEQDPVFRAWHAAVVAIAGPEHPDHGQPGSDRAFYYWGEFRGVTLMLDADRPRTPQQAGDTY